MELDEPSGSYQNPSRMAEIHAVLPRAHWWRLQQMDWPTVNQVEALAMRAIVALFATLHAIWLIRVPGDLDAFNFVLGVRRFDVAEHRPHPPGAPVFIAAGKMATWLWRSLGLPSHRLAGPEPAALAALSLVAGTLEVRELLAENRRRYKALRALLNGA